MSHDISAEVEPQPGTARDAALALQRLGFRILHIGPTISVQASPEVWESAFGVTFEQAQKKNFGLLPEHRADYMQPVDSTVVIPEDLRPLISNIAFAEPPELFL